MQVSLPHTVIFGAGIASNGTGILFLYLMAFYLILQNSR